MKHFIQSFALTFSIVFTSIFASAQVTLHIGDQAPPLKVSKWLQGTPVTSYKKDHLYVFEFWATWCGPCIAAMPHLSELSEQYKNQATFVGVNVWEKTGTKPYESALPSVAAFVKNQGKKLTYNVAADNNEESMGKTWMKAAGQFGIPATFLVQNNNIIWIGHPVKLDSVMPLVISGKYDMEKYKQSFEGKTEKLARMMATVKSFIDPAKVAIKAKEYEKALALLHQGEAATPMFALFYKLDIASVLFSMDEQKGIAYAKEWFKENPGVAGTVIEDLAARTDLSSVSYSFAADHLNKENSAKTNEYPQSYKTLALLYAKLSDFPKAVTAQQKAVELVKLALAGGKYKDAVTDKTLAEYESTLQDYKQKSVSN